MNLLLLSRTKAEAERRSITVYISVKQLKAYLQQQGEAPKVHASGETISLPAKLPHDG
jgi:hypothetical protein